MSTVICLVEEGHITVVKAAKILGLTILELNEIQILIHQESASDVLTNFYSVVNNKQLINFGYLKAYAEVVMAGGMSCEVAAEKLSIAPEEMQDIIENGINIEEYI